MKNTIVINLFGGPGCGKSTAAAEIFTALKKSNIDVELVTEYAKDMTWEKRFNILDDQIYIFAKQYRRISRLIGEVDVIIVDSPLLMCIAYIKESYYTTLQPLILEVWNKCTNLNVFINRKTVYSTIGRSQTADQAIQIDYVIKELLHKHNVVYTSYDIINDSELLIKQITDTIKLNNTGEI